MNFVSVIIPAYNAYKTIKECVESVLKNDYENFEVIVVDDKSTDKTVDILRKIKDSKLKFFINKKNMGSSFSRNTGIKKSKGELIILLDADSYVPIDWIKKHAKIHKKISADIIGGGVVGIHKTMYGKADSFCNWWTSMPNSKDKYINKLHIPTNNMSIKKKLFEKIGYFNEEFSSGGEDSEFCHRALKQCFKIYFKHDLIVYHYDRDNFCSFLKHQKSWGRYAVKLRKELSMDYNWLLPNNKFAARIYIIPLAFIFTLFIISKWIRYKPSVLFYSPLIFLGKFKQAVAIKNSF